MDEVRALVARVAGTADDVRVERIPAGDDAAVAGYECRDGVLTLRGSDPVAAAAAFGQYLKAYAGRQVTWEQPRLAPRPAPWPDAPPTRLTSPFAVRYHLNAVTYGYSAAFWDWDRWEREIDWMALHGVTHPLMQVGHEAVLAETFRRAGLDQARIDGWIGSAAHFPWTFMGNTNSFGGPLPARWISRHVELAQRILDRQRSLGMTPVLPMFGGHVPPELADPSAGEIEWQGWRTPILGPDSERFASLTAEFLSIQRELFGTDHHYAVDPFIESVPPSGEPDYLASVGRAVYRAMADGDPEATWVLQGWPFHYQRDFWRPERVRAFLADVPDERLLLLDLWGEHAPMWRRDGMFGRRWVWCAIHNFGGRFALFGDLDGLRRDVDELRRTRPARLAGVGLAPEAVENNSVFYELATDLTWGVPRLDDWLRSFARQRYASGHEDFARAWRLLADTLYAPGRTRSIPSPVIARPWSADAPFAAQRLAGEFVAQDAEPQRQSANIDAENDPMVLGALPRIASAAPAAARAGAGGGGPGAGRAGRGRAGRSRAGAGIPDPHPRDAGGLRRAGRGRGPGPLRPVPGGSARPRRARRHAVRIARRAVDRRRPHVGRLARRGRRHGTRRPQPGLRVGPPDQRAARLLRAALGRARPGLLPAPVGAVGDLAGPGGDDGAGTGRRRPARPRRRARGALAGDDRRLFRRARGEHPRRGGQDPRPARALTGGGPARVRGVAIIEACLSRDGVARPIPRSPARSSRPWPRWSRRPFPSRWS